ncbi:adenosylcobinamide-GDP ribazoletransferase [Eisenibacter elegans]|uniref:adenosylcobinamide-GDP ribazoletransferase n=1 Tax=Eisenibacter elegans TaxID=997 RepID=UPI0004790C3A|nr:adenosylcobinamide-GDP ribazoletransferase [Eisenibacter elegans]
MKNALRAQIHIFFTALMFYTRIPCPSWVTHSAEYLNKATVYFPVIGWIVGGAAALVFVAAQGVWGGLVAVVLSTIATIWITGAFHEDGFADVCDGFGGGWTKMRILEIMKDSRVGAFGVIGMIGMLGLKLATLYELQQMVYLPPWLIIGHTLSRYTAVCLVATDEYVRENDDAKAKPIAKGMGKKDWFFATLLALVPVIWAVSGLWPVWALLAVLVFGVWLMMGRYFRKRIGGYTGDCLGATQQVAEVVIYLGLQALFTHKWLLV